MRIGTDGRYFVLQNGNLIITNVVKSDEGNYTCEATNRVGRALGSTYLFVEDGIYIYDPKNPEIIVNINQTFYPVGGEGKLSSPWFTHFNRYALIDFIYFKYTTPIKVCSTTTATPNRSSIRLTLSFLRNYVYLYCTFF